MKTSWTTIASSLIAHEIALSEVLEPWAEVHEVALAKLNVPATSGNFSLDKSCRGNVNFHR